MVGRGFLAIDRLWMASVDNVPPRVIAHNIRFGSFLCAPAALPREAAVKAMPSVLWENRCVCSPSSPRRHSE